MRNGETAKNEERLSGRSKRSYINFKSNAKCLNGYSGGVHTESIDDSCAHDGLGLFDGP
jgi:hypothetical protein